MASTAFRSQINSCCQEDLEILGYKYRSVTLCGLNELRPDIFIGHDTLRNHTNVEIILGGVSTGYISPVFKDFTPNCQPIAIKSRRHGFEDAKFIFKRKC